MQMRNRCNRCSRKCNCHCRNCRELPVMPSNPQLANSYVPYQYAEDIFEPCDALEHGTIFPELATSYSPGQSQCMIKYLEGTSTCEEVDENGR